jgi:hypothetical protein
MGDAETSVVIDGGGVPWFASVLGGSGQVYGLALYRGSQGLRVLERLLTARCIEDLEGMPYQQDGLTVWFGPKSELSAMQRERYAALGYQPARGTRMAWPSILNHSPGYMPWAPEASEVAWLAVAIRAVMQYAALLMNHPEVASGRDRLEFPIIPTNESALEPGKLEWRHWSAEADRPPAAALRITTPELEAALRALPLVQGPGLELDWIYLPDTIAEGSRPYHPRAILIFDAATTICLAMELIPVGDNLFEKIGDKLIRAMLKMGTLPERVQVRRPELAQLLGQLLEGLGSKVQLVDRLPAAKSFQEGMLGFLGRR